MAFEKMKIAFIVLKGLPLGGGIEKYTDEVGSRLAARGHEIIVYTMRHYGAKDGMYRGMLIKTVPTLSTKSLEKIVAAFVASIVQCFSKRADIVHFHAFGPAMFCIIPRIFGSRVVVQGHGIEWKRSRWGGLGRLFLKLTELPSVKFPHAVTVVSKVQKAYLREAYGIESVYIPTGVNPQKSVAPELIKDFGLNGGDYILFAARLVSEKGAHYLVEAYNRLETDVKLVIAGDAQNEDVYKAGLRKLAEGNKNIIFTGFATGKLLGELFSNCRFFVLPSEIEGLPTALLEAMSYRNVCLVSDIPENIEALSGLGYTFRNKDVDSLTENMQFLLNEGIDSTMGQKAARHVLENHTWDSIADNFEALYRKVLKG